MTFDHLDAPAELLDLGLKGSGVLELPANTGRLKGTVQDRIERHQALRSMGTRHHLTSATNGGTVIMAGNRIRDRFGTGHTTVLWGIAEATVTGNIIANELQDVRGTNIGGILYLAPAQVRSRARGASESLVPSPT